MAKINTLNYQTVASWNGSQDLFVVEQPDGTKVATPEQVKQYVLGDMDEVPTQGSDNPVKSGGIFSTMAVPKYDSANRREYYEGGAAFSGNIDSTPTAGSNNAVSSGGTKTYVDNAVSTKTGTITLNSGWSFQGGSNSCVKKVGDIAWLSAYIQNANDLTVNTVYQVGTLPEGFRPQKSHSFPIFLKDQSAIRGIVTIENSGIIYYRSLDGSKWILFTTIIFPLT